MKVMLTDICRPKQWKTIAVSDLNENGYWVYGANGIIGQYKNYNHEESVIMITCRGATCGEINISKPKSWINGNAMCLDNLSKQVMIKYLYYCLKAFNFKQIISGSAQPQITLMGLKKIIVEIIPLKAQAEIIQKLDFIEKLIYLKRQQLNKMDDLVKSRFIEMFGDMAFNPLNWPSAHLVDVCMNDGDIKCGPFGTQLGKDEYVDEGVPVWGIPQVNVCFSRKTGDFITTEKAKKLKEYSLISGDIAMSRKGNVGQCAIYPKGYPNGIIHSDVLRIRVSEKLCNPEFLMHQLHFSRAVKTEIDLVSNGAIMAGINVTKLKKINIYIPPIKLQHQFAIFVTQVDKSKLAIQKSLDKLEILQKSLMQQYFG